MPKTKALKWAIGAEEPDDLDEFLSNDDIIAKNTKKKTGEVQWPGKGPFTFKTVQARVKPNRNGDDRIAVMFSMSEPQDSDAASWNGYVIWDGFNVTDQGKQFIKRWLRAMGLEWADFYSRSKQDDQDPPHLVQIGKVKVEGGKPVMVRATVVLKGPDDFNDDDHLEIGRYLPLSDASDDEDDDEPDEPDEEVGDEPDEEDDSGDEDDGDEETMEDLLALDLKDLKKRARALPGVKKADVEGKKKKVLAAMILEAPPF